MKRILICVPALILSFASGASAQDANFDSYPEGVIGQTFTDGGITFSNLDCNFPPGPFSFVAEDASQDLAGMPGFSSPNCVGFFGYSPGPGAAYTRVRSFDMSTGQIATEGRVEVFEFPNYPGNTISLEALMNGNVVNTQTVTQPNLFTVQHHSLVVTGIPFDTLRIQGGGPQDGGVFFGLVDNVHIGNAPPGHVFCSGDGSATACPCGNASPIGAGQGCTSSTGFGSTLRATGTPSLSADTLSLNGAQMPNAPCLYFQGTLQANGGAGSVFGDGLRCAGGTIVRLGTKINAGGASQYPAAGDPSVSVRGQVTTPGIRDYQTWYRNAALFCTPSTFNLTNGLEVTWAP